MAFYCAGERAHLAELAMQRAQTHTHSVNPLFLTIIRFSKSTTWHAAWLKMVATEKKEKTSRISFSWVYFLRCCCYRLFSICAHTQIIVSWLMVDTQMTSSSYYYYTITTEYVYLYIYITAVTATSPLTHIQGKKKQQRKMTRAYLWRNTGNSKTSTKYKIYFIIIMVL